MKPSSGPESVAVAAGSAAVPAAGSASSLLLTEASASGEAVDGLRGYRLAIATQARRFKRYPAQAMASGSEGSADIRIEVGSDGRPRPATVIRSSGHELLDRAALAMIDAGAQRARLPESLRGKTFAVVLPVIFNLDDE
ncbi:MAG: energy transducer TonB [Rhodocyclales bacterium]|nr:energy transducer TonB [Rhodocyclales bacterium]